MPPSRQTRAKRTIPNLSSPSDAKRLIIKIGSALLVDDETGMIRHAWLAALAEDVARCRKRGQDVLIVSSGAVAVGRHHLGLTGTQRSLRLEEKQAAAATGQIRLAHAYEEYLAHHGITVAQILVTPEDTESRRRHLNARETIETLLGLGAVPVINENDTVATDEIRYGDNDRLAARVAQMVGADMLVLLSDIDGLYTADPRKEKQAELLPVVAEITPEIESMAGEPPPGYSSGGMISKLAAARIATNAGAHMIIARGDVYHPIKALEDDENRICTLFLPTGTPKTARKKWIAGHLKPRGSLIVDDGALAALKNGKSLLAAGVTEIKGGFERGDLVTICAADGTETARGLANYGAGEARRILGKRSHEINEILGYSGRDELVHRDNMVMS